MPKPLKIVLLVVLALAVLAGGLWRLKRQFVPDGARITPFLFFSDDPLAVTSPGGRTLHYRFNDGGAMHSGYFWTYFYTDHWFYGKRLVLDGYVVPDVRYSEVPLPITWTGNDSFTVELATSRRDDTPLSKSGVLP